MAETIRKRTPRDLLRMAFRRWRVFLLSAVLFALIALVAAHFITPRYVGTVRFERRIDKTLTPDGLSGLQSPGAFDAEKLTLQHELHGYEAVARVVAAEPFEFFKDLPRADDGSLTREGEIRKREVIHGIIAGLQVQFEINSDAVDLISVSFVHADPNLAQSIPNALVANYITGQSHRRLARLEASRDWLKEHADAAERARQAVADRKIELESKYVGLKGGTQEDIDRRMQQTKADLTAVLRLVDLAEKKYARLLALRNEQVNGVEDLPKQVIKGPNPELERLGAELQEYRVELDLAKTLRKMTDSHPAIVTLQQRIESLEKRIRDTPAEIVIQTIYGENTGASEFAARIAAAQSEVEILSLERDRVASQVQGYEQMMKDFDGPRRQYVATVEELDARTIEAQEWQRRLRDMEMVLLAERENRRQQLSAVELAREQLFPAFPSLLRVFAVAFLGAMAFALGMVLLFNAVDHTIDEPEEAGMRFGVPVQGVISEIVSPRQQAIRGWKRWVLGPAVTAAFVVVLGVASLSIVLWLRQPEQYGQFWSSPATYLYQMIAR